MLCKTINGVHIQAISSALPEHLLDLQFFAQHYGEKQAARVARGTGITSIRVAEDLTTEDLITAAAQSLLQQEQISCEEIDALIVITQTPSQFSPGAAFAVHAKLGLSQDCYVSSVNDGCAGYGNGLLQASALVSSGAFKRVLLCTGDVNTRVVNDDEYQVRMLFGDAASATLLTKGEDSLSFVTGVDGSGIDMLGVSIDYDKSLSFEQKAIAAIKPIKMDGAAVMSFALKRVPEAINALLASKEIDKDDIDLFALHQPNEFMLNYLRNVLDIDKQYLPSDVEGIGNTNSTSIPLLLSRRAQDPSHSTVTDQTESLRNVVLCGFGVGLAWNAVHLDLSRTHLIKPTIVSN